MSKITYTDKEYIYENDSIPEINKITDDDMNEIKSVVNENDTRLTTAEGEIDTAQTDINNAEAVIGNETDTYSASSTYALGSLVIYNSLLYKCTTAITVAEAWNASKWTQMSLTSLIQSNSNYSTTEQIIGKWKNGKPLYRKVLNIGTPSGQRTYPTNGISNLENVIKLYGFCYTDGGARQIIPMTYTNWEIFAYDITDTAFTLNFSTNQWNSHPTNVHIIFEYTKTTD